jgi:hypothetical protein
MCLIGTRGFVDLEPRRTAFAAHPCANVLHYFSLLINASRALVSSYVVIESRLNHMFNPRIIICAHILLKKTSLHALLLAYLCITSKTVLMKLSNAILMLDGAILRAWNMASSTMPATRKFFAIRYCWVIPLCFKCLRSPFLTESWSVDILELASCQMLHSWKKSWSRKWSDVIKEHQCWNIYAQELAPSVAYSPWKSILWHISLPNMDHMFRTRISRKQDEQATRSGNRATIRPSKALRQIT